MSPDLETREEKPSQHSSRGNKEQASSKQAREEGWPLGDREGSRWMEAVPMRSWGSGVCGFLKFFYGCLTMLFIVTFKK